MFGLNALGGSINVQMKNGFTWQGGELEPAGGSFGQRQGEFQWGYQSGSLPGYVAGTVLHTRTAGATCSRRTCRMPIGDLGWRGSPWRAASQRHRGALLTSTVPARRPCSSWPSIAPQFSPRRTISNNYTAASLNGTADLSDQVSLQGLAYYRYFLQNVNNGNAPNDTPCDDGLGPAVLAIGRFSTTFGGVPIADFLNGGQYGELDTQRTSTNAYGAAAQVTDTTTCSG